MNFLRIHRHKKFREILIILAILTTLIVADVLIRPRVENITYSTSSNRGTVPTSPLLITAGSGGIDVTFTIQVQSHQTRSFHIIPDNCIKGVTINNTDAPDMCTHGTPITVDWGPYLTNGTNIVHMTVSDTLGVAGLYSGFSITPSGWEIRIIHTLFLVVLYGYIVLLFNDLVGGKRRMLTTIFVAGILLRAAYVSVTPFHVRDYDTIAHFQYIEYVATHWSIPHAAQGWEFHQAPIYYFLMAVPLRLSELTSMGSSVAKIWMQDISLLFSVLTLGVGIWIAPLLFKREESWWGELLFSLIITSSPVLVYASNRISNDGIYFLVAFIFLAFLLRWWENRSDTSLWLTAVVIGIGFLTRANSYVFLPLLLLCCAARTDLTWRHRVRLMLITLSIVSIIAGWLIALRFFQKDFSRLLLTHDGNPTYFHLENSLRSFVTFNPLRITDGIYPNLWSDNGSRQFFWEHAYQSAFFGWWIFPASLKSLSAWMLRSGFGVLILALFGVLTLQQRKTFFAPVVLSLFIFLSTFAYYRYLHACSCNQDVRYIPLVIPLIAYLAVLAAEKLHPKFRWIFRIWLLWFTALCFAFFIRLWLIS